MNTLVQRQNKTGFALIEIIIALLIIGIMVSLGAPRLFRAGATPFDNFANQLNGLMNDGLQASYQDGKVVKVHFNFKNKKVELKKLEENKENLINSINIPAEITLQQLFINQKEEPGLDESWIFINSDGVAQEYIINILVEGKIGASEKSLVLNPFTVQFKIYDKFSRPKK